MTAIHSEPIPSFFARLTGHRVEAGISPPRNKEAKSQTSVSELFDRHNDHLLDDVGLHRHDADAHRRKGPREAWLTWVPWLI